MDTLPKWLDELVDQILKSDEFVCKHIEDLNGRIDNLGIARLFDLVGCLIDKVEDTQSLLNKSLDRVAQSSVELATANQQLKCTETEIKRIQDCITEAKCQLVTKENELSMADAEIKRLRGLLEPAYTDTDLREPGSQPTTINDYIVLLSSYIADYMPSEAVPNDEYFGAWENAARPLLQRVFDEIASLNRQLDAVAVLLRRPERVTWGYDSDHRVMAYFLDGNYAGDTLRDVILAAATTGV